MPTAFRGHEKWGKHGHSEQWPWHLRFSSNVEIKKTFRMKTNEPVNILIVDDMPEKIMTIEATLEELGQNIVKAYSGREALRCLLKDDYAVILLDVNMPEMDGF